MPRGKKDKKKKEDKELYAYYIELESELDFARQAVDSSNIKALKEGAKYRLIDPAEKLGDVRLVYYTMVPKVSNFLVYNPGYSGSKEVYEIKDTIAEHADYRSFRAPIVELVTNPYSEVKDLKKAGKIMKVEVKDYKALVKSVAGRARDEDTPSKLYAFFNGSDHILGTFEFFREGEIRIFAYAKTQPKEKFNALNYNYSSNLIQPVNSFMFPDNSSIYIRVINLKKPFPFF